MPYKLKKKGKGYVVTSPNHKSGFSKHPLPKKRAKAQLAAIYANTHGEGKKVLDDIEAILTEGEE